MIGHSSLRRARIDTAAVASGCREVERDTTQAAFRVFTAATVFAELLASAAYLRRRLSAANAGRTHRPR